MFTWQEDYSVHHPVIDEQHQKLFTMGKAMEDLVKHHAGEDIYDELNAMLTELINYTIYHFSTEEEMMAAAGYPGLDIHKSEHDKFIHKLNNLDLTDMEDSQGDFALKLLKTVATWIFKHIMGQDFQYKGQI